jgi:hypothetical protein
MLHSLTLSRSLSPRVRPFHLALPSLPHVPPLPPFHAPSSHLLDVYRLAHHLHVHTHTHAHTRILSRKSSQLAVSRYALCQKSQFIFLYMHCAFLHKAYLLTAQCRGTGATQPAIETTMSARPSRSRIALWMVCVSCTFLTQAPLFTHSLSNAAYIVPPQPHQPAAIRLATGVASSHCIKPARRLITAQRRWCCTQGAKVDP